MKALDQKKNPTSDISLVEEIIGSIIAQNIKKRKLVFWVDNINLRTFLQKRYNINASFFVTRDTKKVNEFTKDIKILKHKSDSYFIVNISLSYNKNIIKFLNELGYMENKDFLLFGKTPIVIKNYDLSKGAYMDTFGNSIDGEKGIIKKIIFRGFNNTIRIGKDVNVENITYFDLSNNSHINISNNVNFMSTNTKFELLDGGINGKNEVIIGTRCRFRDVLFRLLGHKEGSSISIGELSSFENNVELHSNIGKSILIGKDCMFSRNIQIWAGDGHSTFDILSKTKINGYDREHADRNFTVIGNHVWVCTNAIILSGTKVGEGSVIGAGSVVKGKYPNNCVIAGNPSSVVKINVAWSRNGKATDISESNMYFKNTKSIS